jgi:threonine dehydrogenase-like Zn-dependent dehydrogenase
MKAVAKLRPEAGAMAVIDLPTPEPGLGEALVQIQAGGICGTDVAIWHWHTAVVGQYAPTFPLIVGHEFSGKVIKPSTGGRVKVGEIVAINPQIACGHCYYCGLGQPTLCDDRKLMGTVAVTRKGITKPVERVTQAARPKSRSTRRISPVARRSR